MARWYFSTNGKAEGPVTPEDLIEKLKTGQLTLVDLVFKEGESAWKTCGEIPEFRAAYQAPPVFVPPPPQGIFPSQNEIDLDEISIDDFTPTPIHSKSLPHVAEPVPEFVSAPLTQMVVPESTSAKEFQKPEEGWPSDWRLSSSWIVLKKLTNGSGYEQDGPFSAEHIIEMIGSGKIDYSQYCWKPGYTRWFRIGNLPEFDRRKRDRENDTVNQIIPVPAIAEALPALSREELLENVERMRRNQRKEKAPAGTTGQNLVETPFDALPVRAPKLAKPATSVFVAAAPATNVDEADSVSAFGSIHTSGEHAAAPAVVHEPSSWAPSSSAAVPVRLKNQISPILLRVGVAIFVAAVVVFALVQASTMRTRQPASQKAPQAAPEATKTRKQLNTRPKSSLNDESVPQDAPAASVGPTKVASSLEIAPQNLDSAAPALTFQTDMDANDKIVVKLKARTGDILKYGSYLKTFDVVKSETGVPVLDLSKEDLPTGSYSVEASVGSVKTLAQIFIGKKDGNFPAELERHLKSLSYRQQSEKSALYYGAQKLEKLSKDLVTQSQILKAQPLKWRRTFAAWRTAARDAALPVLMLAQSSAFERAYPEEIAAFQAATDHLASQAKELDSAVLQKRDVASFNEVSTDFGKLRESSAKLSGRPETLD